MRSDEEKFLNEINNVQQETYNKHYNISKEEFALKSHKHSEYASVNHKHSDYASKHHSHSQYVLEKDMVNYALANHTHDFANKYHTHTQYAEKSHSHNYALKNHTHSYYADKEHTHSQYATKQDLEEIDVNIDTTQFAPNVHEHEQYALADHTHGKTISEKSFKHLFTNTSPINNNTIYFDYTKNEYTEVIADLSRTSSYPAIVQVNGTKLVDMAKSSTSEDVFFRMLIDKQGNYKYGTFSYSTSSSYAYVTVSKLYTAFSLPKIGKLDSNILEIYVEGNSPDIIVQAYGEYAEDDFDRYLYYEGEEFVDFTGGWVEGYSTNGYTNTKTENTLEVSTVYQSSSGNYGSFITNYPIDLTHANTIEIEWTYDRTVGSGRAQFNLFTGRGVNSSTSSNVDFNKNFTKACERAVEVIDVSTFTGSYYVSFGTYVTTSTGNNTIKVHSIKICS